MSNNKKTPAIRFKGFTDDWEQRKAVSLFDSVADKGYPELPVLSATQDRGMIKRDENGINIFHDKKNEEGYKRVLPGNFVIHLRSFQGGFAHSSIEGITSPAYTVFGFKEREKHDDVFWKYIFRSKEFISRLETVTYGIRDGRSINYDEFLTMTFTYPDQVEQSEISQYLTNLDNLITLQKRKCDKLILLKKAMLEQMFPKGKKSIPEIRFKGFNDDWEERKLGELGSVAMNKRIFKDQTSEVGDVPFYKIGTFGGEPDAYIPRELFEEYKVKYPYPEVGDILISASGSIGRTVEYIGEDEYFQDSNIVWLKHDGRLNNSFLKQFYMMVEWEGLEGSTIKRLYNKNILETQILLPSLAEQEKIGTFFRTLDNLITLQKRKLEKLKIIKKSMLDKMFI